MPQINWKCAPYSSSSFARSSTRTRPGAELRGRAPWLGTARSLLRSGQKSICGGRCWYCNGLPVAKNNSVWSLGPDMTFQTCCRCVREVWHASERFRCVEFFSECSHQALPVRLGLKANRCTLSNLCFLREQIVGKWSIVYLVYQFYSDMVRLRKGNKIKCVI